MAAKLKVGSAELLEHCRDAIKKHYGEHAIVREWDPVVEAAIAAADPELPPLARSKLNLELLPYFYAKRKPVDENGDSKDGFVINLIQFSDSEREVLAVREGGGLIGHDSDV